MKRYVLDASALLAFFEGEPGADRVEALLRHARDSGRPLLLSVVNWGEVYYVTWQQMSEVAAHERAEQIARLPIELVAADAETALLAATFKARHKLPYADCFAAALARQQKAALVTTDKDFLQVEREVSVLWAERA